LLSLSTIGERKIKVTTKYNATNGAVLNNISYDFGDTKPAMVTKETTVEYTYTEDGTYTVRATPSFTVDGEVVKAADNANCAKVVTFSKGEVETPPAETPATGAGETIGFFVGASLVSAFGYRTWLTRRS
jgi:PKD repeat protein